MVVALSLLLACAPRVPVEGVASRASPGADVELLDAGPVEARLAAPDGADLVLFYGGEERGSLEPCGCPNRPRGGVARAASVIAATRAARPDVPALVVNGGYWLEDAMGLDGLPRPDVPVLNRWMVIGLAAQGFDALNVGYNDMAGITSIGETPDLPMVSANVRGDGVAPWRVVQAGELRVGITGITAPGLTFLPTPGFSVEDPVRAGRAALAELRGEADLIVLLAFQAPEAARTLAQAGLADVVIDTALHRTLDAPFRVGDAVWVRSHLQTMRLGELRLTVDDGRITRALDRKIDLDPEISEEPTLMAIAKDARREIDRAQKEALRR